MACGGCSQRRDQLVVAYKAAAVGDLKTAGANVADVARSMKDDAGALALSTAQRLSAAHARLKKR